MATLYDISWAFTVYHLLQLPLNAVGHKRQSSSHFTKGKGGRNPIQILQSEKGFHMLKCTIVNRFRMSLLVTATLPILRDGWFLQHTAESWFPNSNQQCSRAAKVCSRVALRCSWDTFPSLVGLSLVFPFRCSQCYSLMCLRRAGSERSHFSSKISEKNAPFLSVPFWGWEIKCRKLEVPAKPSQDSLFKWKGSFRWQVAL